MEPSGYNSIEYVLHFLLQLFKFAGWVLLIVIVGPVLYLIWSSNTMSSQARAITALNQGPVTTAALNLNRCSARPGQVAEAKAFALANSGSNYPVDPAPVTPLPFEVLITYPSGGSIPSRPFMLHHLPWAPGLFQDEQITRIAAAPSYGTSEGMHLNHYRRMDDIPHADPWYYHGLFKLAPTQRWDTGTGPDYAFAKVTGNYKAYVGAVRAVDTMRLLLGGRAMGADDAAIQIAASLEHHNPLTAYANLNSDTHGSMAAFMRGYSTDFGDKLPVVVMDLQKFDEATFGAPANDEHMGWWGGTGAGGGTNADNSRDYFITGMRIQGQAASGYETRPGRPAFTFMDFLVYHLPQSTSSQDVAWAAMAQVTTDAFWDQVLPPEYHSMAHQMLGIMRKNLEFDCKFSRKYGHLLFSGDRFGRDPSIMNE